MHHARVILHARGAAAFDARYGTDTVEPVALDALTVVDGDASEGRMYVGSPPCVLRYALPALAPDPAGATFVDMGSGKGRALMLAALHGFRSCVGVEFGAELHEAALRNVAAFDARTGLGARIAPRLGDATRFAWPDGPLLVFFNNPFRAPVLAAVLDGLAARQAADPSPVTVLYQSMRDAPAHTGTAENLALLDAAPFLEPRPLRVRDPRGRFLLQPFALRAHGSRPGS